MINILMVEMKKKKTEDCDMLNQCGFEDDTRYVFNTEINMLRGRGRPVSMKLLLVDPAQSDFPLVLHYENANDIFKHWNIISMS